MSTQTSTKLRPLGNKVVIKPAESDTKSAGGIYLPDSAQKRPHRGEVLSVGPGRTLENGTLVEPEVKIGDTVYYGRYGGSEVTIDGQDLVIITEDDIHCIWEN